MKYFILILCILNTGCMQLDRLLNGKEDTIKIIYPKPTPPVIDNRIPVYIGMGQSNMSGLNDYGLPSPLSNLEFLTDPGTGPLLYFGIDYAIDHGSIAVLQCAVSATWMKDWETDLYWQCLDKVDELDKSKYKIQGILFAQGFADTQDNPKTTLTWASSFVKLMKHFRLSYPDTIIMMAELGRHKNPVENHPYWDHIKKEQRSVKLTNFHRIFTEDLPLFDNAHYTALGYKELARRFLMCLNLEDI